MTHGKGPTIANVGFIEIFWEEIPMNFASRGIGVLFVATLFTGYASAGPRDADPLAANASRGSMAAAMAGIIATDKQMVADGLDPPEILKYDMELSEIIPEGEDILAKRDKVRAAKWQKKYNAIMKARHDAVQRFAAKSIAAANAITNTFGGIRRPNPCLNAMGRNICATPAPQSGGVHVCPDGVGMIGTGPSGEPLCN